MISREQLAQEYINIINNYYPVAGRLLRHCLVKILKLNADRTNKHSYYLGIYYPDKIGSRLLALQDLFKDAAENLGLVEVVFLNANHLVRDPRSKIKEQDFRFWLELCWIANETN
ncbi:MAG: hypothetical protein QNJ70_01995 [Xenococcaceae cyanobacterium MO_207.B15]|nr:hypothetical protein [Xenococcaceae cyanobacterium MO_207.B15]MDJ0741768.1 hypothetical protein [Xenococcaceae cyanobacterium MO_167.B27]